MAKYSFEFKRMVVMEYLKGFGSLLASGDNSQLESGENRQFQSE